jgi:hypothetical protein
LVFVDTFHDKFHDVSRPNKQSFSRNPQQHGFAGKFFNEIKKCFAIAFAWPLVDFVARP